MLEPNGLPAAAHRWRHALALVLALALASATPVGASSSWRCGNRLVHDGDTADEVWRRCGEPTFRTASVEALTVRYATGHEVTRLVAIETWTYNRGPREFVRYLVFRDGRLRELVEGGYGY